ncbi:MAG: acyl-protein synthetase [Deltaproteobacteria bacterium]|nr:acyl-protein synthetase [Deltaproteobacteria bacterium]
MTTRAELKARVEALITSFEAGRPFDAAARDELIEDLATWQARRIPEYGRLQRRGVWPPALPTDVFRFRRIAAHPEERDLRTFRSSGTTCSERSVHLYCDLGLYDFAARVAARHMLFPDLDRMRLVILAPHEDEARDSSLEYMLARFAEWFATQCTWVWQRGALDLERLTEQLRSAEASGEPVAVLGTSFAFVHAEDGLGDRRFELPPGSRIMQTGGYKGRSREFDSEVLLTAIGARYGIAAPRIIDEFGATELSSQMYSTTLRDELDGSVGPRRLWVPPWVRATPVDPDTLEPVDGDTVGILRIDDTANLDSVCCIQTADLARRLHDGIVVLGRAPGAIPRGCSLAADQALGEQ